MGISRREVKRNLARRLRRQSTTAERHLWGLLRDRRLYGLKFRRQHVIRGFIADSYCHELRLVLEVDGSHHLDSASATYDRARSAIFGSLGLQVVRIPNDKATRQFVFDAIIRVKNPEDSSLLSRMREKGTGGEGEG